MRFNKGDRVRCTKLDSPFFAKEDVVGNNYDWDTPAWWVEGPEWPKSAWTAKYLELVDDEADWIEDLT